MHRRTSLPLATLAGAAVIAGLLIAPTASPLTQAVASDGTVFIGPNYPNQDECITLVGDGSNTFGVVPQQWNAVVGLPVVRSGNPAAQRIVIPEFDQIPSMPAVNALLRQCGLLAADAPDFALVQQTLPAGTWGGSPLQTLGGEATLDASIVYAALPPNTDVIIANTPSAASWYGFFVNAAQACGIEFETAPLPSNTAATVPTMSKGPDFPAGGCIITASWGANEQVAFSGGSLGNTQAASVVLQRLAALGVLTFISAGDEGAGGCLSGGNPVSITNVVLTTPNSTTTIGTPPNTRTFFTGTATFTIVDNGGNPFTAGNFPFSVNNEVLINRLTGPPGIKSLSGIFQVTAINTANSTFTIQQGLSERFEITPSEASGSATLYTGTNFGWTEDPVYDAATTIKFAVQNGTKMPSFPATHPDVVAVGGTQWLPQSETTRLGLGIPFEPGRPYQEFVWKDSNPNPNCANAPDAFVLGQEGTGGGESGQFDMPSYQRTAAQASYGDLSGRKRMMPDIAALAGWPMYGIAEPDPLGNGSPTAANFCAGGNFPCAAATFPWDQEVGTSAATPLSAVGFANVNAALTARGFAPITKGGSNDIHSIIYNPANSSAIRDVPEFRGAVRSGDNNLFGSFNSVSMGYSALNGFDMATGMGVPNFTALANLLIARNTPAPPGPGPAPAPQPDPAPQPAPQPAPAPQPNPGPDPVTTIITNPSAVTAGTISSLTPAQVAAIPPATFGQLPPRAFRGLTPDQARQLSTGQVAAIRPARARAIRPAVLRSFTPQQVETLRPKAVRALRPAQVRLLRPEQISALSNRQVRALRPKQVQEFTAAQRRALTPGQRAIIERKSR